MYILYWYRCFELVIHKDIKLNSFRVLLFNLEQRKLFIQFSLSVNQTKKIKDFSF